MRLNKILFTFDLSVIQPIKKCIMQIEDVNAVQEFIDKIDCEEKTITKNGFKLKFGSLANTEIGLINQLTQSYDVQIRRSNKHVMVIINC